MTELCSLSARKLSRALAGKQASAREVLAAYLARIDAVNPVINAIVSIDAEAAYAQADAVDSARAKGAALSPYAGMPIAIKDTNATKGLRTTQGSRIYADHIPATDSWSAERMRGHGLVILGKTNVPEFAMGSHTFNDIFGVTRNPWNLGLSAGGSSGGAAAAVASSMLPFADGSDLGGSLRNPANFCGVVGLRPSPGTVPSGPGQNDLWFPYAVQGPIARSACDAAFLLQAQSGLDIRDPISNRPAPDWPATLDRDFRGTRVAWSPSLGGLPVEPAVADALAASLARFEALGCRIEQVDPDLAEADEAFHVLRAASMGNKLGPLLAQHRDKMKDAAIWNIEAGLALTIEQLYEAKRKAARVFHRMRTLMETYDFLLCPASQVLPFDSKLEYPASIGGEVFDNYLGWMKLVSRITMTLHPAVSAPVAFTPDGLPVGMQIVGRYRDELGVLQLCHAVELPVSERRPPMPAPLS
jgi:amidase